MAVRALITFNVPTDRVYNRLTMPLNPSWLSGTQFIECSPSNISSVSYHRGVRTYIHGGGNADHRPL